MQVNLKKLLAKPELAALLTEIGSSFNAYIEVVDIKGDCLLRLGQPDSYQGTKQAIASCFPVVVEAVTIGHVQGTAPAAHIAKLLTYLAKQDLEKRGLANELLEKYHELDLFYEISTKLTASLDLQEIAQLVLREAYTLVEATSGVMLLRRAGTSQLEVLSQVGADLQLPTAISLGEGLIGNIVQAGREELVNQLSTDPRPFEGDRAVQNLICVPLITEEQVTGAIVIATTNATPYSTEDLKQVSIFASQTAMAIEKALLHQQALAAADAAQTQAQQLHAALIDLQHAQAQLIQTEKMSSLGQLVAGVAHEINNPVNFIYGNLVHASGYVQDLLELLMRYRKLLDPMPPDLQAFSEAIDLEFLMEDLPQLLTSMQVGADRILEIVKSLRNFSRLDEAEMKAVDIHDGLDSTLMILHNRLKPRGHHPGIEVVKQYGNLPLVECYPGQLNQVFMNILVNAIDALDEFSALKYQALASHPADQPVSWQPKITIHTELIDAYPEHGAKTQDCPPESTKSVVIRIADNGPGMTEDVKQRLFDPFFTTKEVGKGTGLGMAISHQIIVERHGGLLKCRSHPGEGAEFWIQIPLKAANASSKPRGIRRLSPSITPQPPKTPTPLVNLTSATDTDGYVRAQVTSPDRQHLLNRHLELLKKLTHANAINTDDQTGDLYHLFQAHPILLRLYTILLTDLY
ncbi:MAG: GAF domain-containing sensor histidine kinase [Cyanobacteria bacterium]|nr:GAF domain-containing sensor histidine kinase [Cyanobacteriota bacterium]MDW8200062.1 ATP-binding protein [Cyanobacteriota bacterium SKYGB_h_bin112]